MKNIKILIVEDEPLIADDLAFTLKDIGYGIAGICMGGKEAIDLIDKEEVDLILMDINIEGEMDGISLAEEVNKLYDIPII